MGNPLIDIITPVNPTLVQGLMNHIIAKIIPMFFNLNIVSPKEQKAEIPVVQIQEESLWEN